jgi:nicotinate dehydrogenase subunit A
VGLKELQRARFNSKGTCVPTFSLHVNGQNQSVVAEDPDMPLLYALRGDLGLRGPKFGCGLGQCGACTILMDGEATRSCQLPISVAPGHALVTLEGLGADGRSDPVQAAFIAEQAGQCAYCSNGMIMQAKTLLATNPNPSEQDVRDGLAANLCRCGAHVRIVRAVLRAADMMRSGG